MRELGSLGQVEDRIDETLEAAQEHSGHGGIIQQRNDVETSYQTAAEAFVLTYEERYGQRYETYTDSIDNVWVYAGDDINNKDLESALSDLTERLGVGSVGLEISSKDHINPSPSLTRLINL